MTSKILRQHFLDFFKEQGHQVIPSASLVPENDPSVLFTTAGMQQFKRYYADPSAAPSARITTVQKCLRTSDIDEVGDSTHLTFFEMLGNFSFGFEEGMKESDVGPYFKEKAIEYAWKFLTEKLEIPKSRIYATYYGEEGVSLDVDLVSEGILSKYLDKTNIKQGSRLDNFWFIADEFNKEIPIEGSPGGRTVEFYVAASEESATEGEGVEIWNLVFNEFQWLNGSFKELKYKGVDTGVGLERLAATMQGKDDVYETDLFSPIVQEIEKLSGKKYQSNEKAFRVIADNIKAATFLLSEGIVPSNKDQGYIARRLIRRATVKASEIGIKENFTTKLAEVVFGIYHTVISTEMEKSINRSLDFARDDIKGKILSELEKEESKFRKNLKFGLMKIDLLPNIKVGFEGDLEQRKSIAKDLFDLYQSNGFPWEVSIEEIQKRGGNIRDDAVSEVKKMFDEYFKEHQKLSRTASAGRFKGGLADVGEETIKLHTAAHLLLAALREIYGPDTNQKGSNITAERLRFDFNHAEKMTPEEIKKAQDIVNKNIADDLPVTMEKMSIMEAKESGATGVFDDRYGDKVKVYTIGDIKNPVSREICGGPHIEHTGQLGHFKITKEESSSSGIRRIKAILE